MALPILKLLYKPVQIVFSNFASSTPFLGHVGTLHTTASRQDLMEFFEKKDNWGKTEIKSGRAWKLDELRIKSNEDLHKLWYILYKEKNMLLTVEHEYKENYVLFPNPERIDKVEESMKNLETVVRERNKAYYMLETGIDGEQPRSRETNAIGISVSRKQTQHLIPKSMNRWFKENFFLYCDFMEVREFQKFYREKLYKQNQYIRKQNNIYVRGIMQRHKNVDLEALKKAYPDMPIDNLKNYHSVRGHWVP